jgi:peptide/nickel transport system ATP-binding protein
VTPSPTPLLVAEDLVRRFGRNVPPVLDGVAVTVARGEVVGLVGPSGSGKTTLARLLVALDRPTSGDVAFDGVSLFSASARALRALRPRFQLVVQDPLAAADPRWTARRTLDEAIAAGRRAGDPCALAEVLHLARIDASTLDRRPYALSGGERQRIALGRAFAVDPELVVLDEPTASLDVVTRRELLGQLLAWRARRGAALVVISHDLRLVAALATRVLVLQGGRIVANGPPREVMGPSVGLAGA